MAFRADIAVSNPLLPYCTFKYEYGGGGGCKAAQLRSHQILVRCSTFAFGQTRVSFSSQMSCREGGSEGIEAETEYSLIGQKSQLKRR